MDILLGSIWTLTVFYQDERVYWLSVVWFPHPPPAHSRLESRPMPPMLSSHFAMHSFSEYRWAKGVTSWPRLHLSKINVFCFHQLWTVTVEEFEDFSYLWTSYYTVLEIKEIQNMSDLSALMHFSLSRNEMINKTAWMQCIAKFQICVKTHFMKNVNWSACDEYMEVHI